MINDGPETAGEQENEPVGYAVGRYARFNRRPIGAMLWSEMMMSAERLTVLLAEDDQKDVMMINLALERDGIPAEFHLVNDGEQVVEYLAGTGLFRNRSRYPFPDLVIVDLKMSRMGGMDVVKWLRNDLACSRMPVVILSGSGQMEDVREAYQAGANSYFQKPSSVDQLQTLLRAIVRYWLLTEKSVEVKHCGHLSA